MNKSSETVLIVDGFEWQVPESDLRRLFEQIGPVLKIKVGRLSDGSPSATITMARAQDAVDAILKYDGTHYRRTVLRVKPA